MSFDKQHKLACQQTLYTHHNNHQVT